MKVRLRFIDSRPAFRYAFACARKHFKWLIELFPDDCLQEISLSSLQVQEAGPGLGRAVCNNMRRLAQELGYRRSTKDGKRFWLRDSFDEYLEFRSGMASVVPLSSRHGTTTCYNGGCRCDECRLAQSVYFAKWRSLKGSHVGCRRHPGSPTTGKRNRCLGCLQELASVMREAKASRKSAIEREVTPTDTGE